MGRKSRLKKERRKQKNAAPATPSVSDESEPELTAAGDLRLIEPHVKNFIKGVEEAEGALRMMGRDASQVVVELGEALEDERVVELGKNLVAVKPQVPTNLRALRHASVAGHVAEAGSSAPLLIDGGAVAAPGNVIALFDPMRVADALVKSGRPRTDAERVGKGDLAIFPLPAGVENVTFSLEAPPEGQDTSDVRLTIDSGVAFIGPPEASDGPRMGEIRIHPFRTGLDDFLERGSFRRVEAGRYDVRAYQDGETVCVHLTSAADDADDGPLEPGAIALPPPKSEG